MDIKFLVMDVDGTLTDGMLHIGAEGELYKSFNCKDGYGIHHILPDIGIVPVIITGRNSLMLKKRCEEIAITQLYQGVWDKPKVLKEVLEEYSQAHGVSYDYSNVAFIGDDLNDMDIMSLVGNGGGLTACPADAVKEIYDLAMFRSTKDGGKGAVREFIDYIRDKE